jgi:asparagine N-glycosylation enzyme membrane subunit Stt3
MVGFHARFYVLFGWRREFEEISPLNARVFYTIHLALLLLFLGFAVLSLVFWRELARGEGLAAGVTVTYALFWFWRTMWQLVYFRPPRAARGPSRPVLRYGLPVLFAALCVLYFVPFAAAQLR